MTGGRGKKISKFTVLVARAPNLFYFKFRKLQVREGGPPEARRGDPLEVREGARLMLGKGAPEVRLSKVR